jgi:glycosyltransferase involved in cell wall biosynthesis
MKIAFLIIGDDRWMAGEVILRNLLLSIRELGLDDVKLTLVTPEGGDRDRIQSRYAPDEFLYYPLPTRFSAAWFSNRVSTRFLQRDAVLDPFLRRNGVDVLFGACFSLRYPSVATLTWVPDFQHVHMPEMFSPQERAERDHTFEETARISTRVILLSRAVAADFQTRVPLYASKARVLSPITRVPERIYDGNPADVARRYHLPEKFFYLPNQFWAHKNHERVFAAIRDLQARGTEVNLVCTGFPGDYRNVGHFAALWEKIARWDVGRRISYLGLIPHDDVLGLVRQSICVVNPSKFEGWGIGIDEARSIGKRILASDLPSHREQDPPSTIYFDPESPEDLSAKLLDVWKAAAPGPDRQLEQAARSALPGRIRRYAEAFVSVAREAARQNRPMCG